MTDTRVAHERVLLLAPTGRDAALIRDALSRASLSADACRDATELCEELDRGAGAVIVADEALRPSVLGLLAEWARRQPAWSDLPFIVLTSQPLRDPGDIPITARYRQLGNVDFLERPMPSAFIVRAVERALRARRRQYESRDLHAQQEAAVRHRDEFLALLGHELRNPLAAIATVTKLMAGSEPQDGARYREILERQVGQLGRLVDDLLDVARVTSGKVKLRSNRIDLLEVVGRCVATVEPQVRERGITLMFSRSHEPAFTEGDPARLEQVVMNLVGNATKFTPSGGRVHLSAARESAAVVLRIRDEGIGMRAETLERLFEPFSQAEASLARSHGGLGVGLAIVRGLVELHGGTIQAFSAGLGKGSEFVVRLPALDDGARSAPDERVGVQGMPVSAARHVLVVEDNPDNRETLEMFLEQLGHEVATAADGPSGVEAMRQGQFDAMVIDIGLPGIDGYEVARRVRAMLGDTPLLVALTGYGQPEDRRKALEAGFDVHLTKSADLDAVRLALEGGRPSRTSSGATESV